MQRLIKLADVKKITSLSKSSIYKFMREKTFPMSIPIGDRAIAWLESEVYEWIENKINSRK